MGWFGSSRSSHRPSFSRTSSSYSRSSDHGHSSRSGSSYYKRRPRDGFINGLIHKLKHLFRELYYFARRNPVKVFFLVIMPLISGGVLAGVAKQFGIKLPSFLQGKHSSRGGGGGYYGSKGYGRDHDGGLDMGGLAGGLGGLGGLSGLASGGNLGSLMSVAKAFL
jgi:hypothetical protein